MNVWRFSPNYPDDHRWIKTEFKGPFIVRDVTERKARHRLQIRTAQFKPSSQSEDYFPHSPWIDPKHTCAEVVDDPQFPADGEAGILFPDPEAFA